MDKYTALRRLRTSLFGICRLCRWRKISCLAVAILEMFSFHVGWVDGPAIVCALWYTSIEIVDAPLETIFSHLLMGCIEGLDGQVWNRGCTRVEQILADTTNMRVTVSFENVGPRTQCILLAHQSSKHGQIDMIDDLQGKFRTTYPQRLSRFHHIP